MPLPNFPQMSLISNKNLAFLGSFGQLPQVLTFGQFRLIGNLPIGDTEGRSPINASRGRNANIGRSANNGSISCEWKWRGA